MLKEILAIPRYVIGHICLLLAIAMAQFAHWLSFFGAICLDHEDWWHAQDEEIATKLKELE